jgi:signal transduction histidine kinase
MAALVHESRNALQRSSACLEMLALEVEDRPEALDLVRRTQRAQNQLRDLYEEVRQWAAPMNLLRERTNLAAVWREAWQQAMHPHATRQLELRECISCEPVCRADAAKLSQVFRNIFENAIEVSPDPGHIDLRCDMCASSTKGELRISIADEGPGLSAEQRTHMFEPFFTTKAKGTGLGMAIAKRIVLAHHGHIAADSPKGARIEITLPKGTI